MGLKGQIEEKLKNWASFLYLEVINESYMHSVPDDAETHFKVVAVTQEFSGKSKVARHQQVYKLLAEEMSGPVHALALHLYSPDEWSKSTPVSPQCMGGSKSD